MPPHTARPSSVSLKIDGMYCCLTSSQASTLKSFDEDGVMRDLDPDVQSVRQLARRGWVLRSRGHFVLTSQGKAARTALADYLSRKDMALEGGATS